MARRPTNLTGKVFGTFTAISYAGKVGRNLSYPSWLCQCECGQKTVIPKYQLLGNHAPPCPFCQPNIIAQPVWIGDQRVVVVPKSKADKLPSIGEFVRDIQRNTDANAILIMISETPSESLQNLGADLGGGMDEADSADSAGEEWENSAIHFDKPIDKQ